MPTDDVGLAQVFVLRYFLAYVGGQIVGQPAAHLVTEGQFFGGIT